AAARALGAAVAFAAAEPPARAAPASVAVVVGNNVGLPGEPVLRYAEDDASRIADVLRAFGSFTKDGVTVLRGRTVADVRRAIADAEGLLAKSADGLLFVYYSGHADG